MAVQSAQPKGTVIQTFRCFLKSEHTVTTSGGTITCDPTMTSCTADRTVIFPTFVCASKRNVEIYRHRYCCCCRLGADYFATSKVKALHRIFQSKYQTLYPA